MILLVDMLVVLLKFVNSIMKKNIVFEANISCVFTNINSNIN